MCHSRLRVREKVNHVRSKGQQEAMKALDEEVSFYLQKCILGFRAVYVYTMLTLSFKAFHSFKKRTYFIGVFFFSVLSQVSYFSIGKTRGGGGLRKKGWLLNISINSIYFSVLGTYLAVLTHASLL